MSYNGELFKFQKREVSKAALRMLKVGASVWVPLCPDYVSGGIGDGVSQLMLSAIEAAKEVQASFPLTSFSFLLADTEEDIMKRLDRGPCLEADIRVVPFGFNRRHIRSSATKINEKLRKNEIVGQVSLFSDLWPDWHVRQYDLEIQVTQALSQDAKLDGFFQIYESRRQSRYSMQYVEDRMLSIEETRKLQVRHYTQYLLLQDLMRERDEWVLMNYLTENLRAITGHHAFLPVRRKVELIVY